MIAITTNSSISVNPLRSQVLISPCTFQVLWFPLCPGRPQQPSSARHHLTSPAFRLSAADRSGTGPGSRPMRISPEALGMPGGPSSTVSPVPHMPPASFRPASAFLCIALLDSSVGQGPPAPLGETATRLRPIQRVIYPVPARDRRWQRRDARHRAALVRGAASPHGFRSPRSSLSARRLTSSADHT